MISLENIIIRPLTELSEFIEAIEVQKQAWNRDDYSLIPPTMFKSFSKNGGCVIGALTQGDGKPEKVIGYVIGFLSISKTKILYHHSQQVAVLPEYQQLGIAYKLKLAQKEYVRQNYNVEVMTWTVDPLLSKNAFLNFHKLGTIGRIYWVNYYGSREDNLNSGLETDRIEVEYWFSEEQQSFISNARSNIPNEFNCYDYSESGSYPELNIKDQSFVGVVIPRDLVELKKKNIEIAKNYILGASYGFVDLDLYESKETFVTLMYRW